MDAFDVLADPVRRRLLVILSQGAQPAGTLVDVIRAEFDVSQPAVSQHLKILRDHGFAEVRAHGARRIYSIAEDGIVTVEQYLAGLRSPLSQSLDALHTEIARGHRSHSRTQRTSEQRKDAS